jgi:predicted CoA-binding protein
MRDVEAILRDSKTIAVVGISPRPDRDSHVVAKYLQGQGYRVIPVNPTVDEVLGEKCYPSVRDVPEPIDIVDIFRRPVDVPPVVDDAIAVGAKVVWMQLKIIHEEAAAKAEANGLDVVMDKCTKPEHEKLVAAGRLTGRPV